MQASILIFTVHCQAGMFWTDSSIRRPMTSRVLVMGRTSYSASVGTAIGAAGLLRRLSSSLSRAHILTGKHHPIGRSQTASSTPSSRASILALGIAATGPWLQREQRDEGREQRP